ncbi:SDR family NAD(P)-dependent oxidoreductase [Streptomyces sp. SCSIO ZS0520]|uniref:SDR family NAD(P)-dependent oxidoreductase n=1 Tax=Streptomyces sp. SCSIO ZS0520 TaxID=2892996 RepID=UPI0021DB3660|nr:SDR family NAD(P)-dependent oxidoreductase [Streptomyces sp. SCSIO ZS0520]
MTRLDGYGVLVTGAGQGIGEAVARRCARLGARVLVTDLAPERARRVAGLIGDEGGRAEAAACDVRDPEAVAAAVGRAVEAFGGLDVLVNNAYAAHPDPARFEEYEDGPWLEDFDVIVNGAFRCCRAAMRHLAAAGGRGAVVNIGSVNAQRHFGGHAYSAAKAALGSLTRTLAVENAPRGVRVNLVEPGTIRTSVWDSRPGALELAARSYPLGRVGEPGDVAAAVTFLASADAAWITGVTLPVDGGLLVSNMGLTRDLGGIPEPDSGAPGGS